MLLKQARRQLSSLSSIRVHLQAEVGDHHARVPFLLKDVPPRGKLLVALRRQDDYAGQHLI